MNLTQAKETHCRKGTQFAGTTWVEVLHQAQNDGEPGAYLVNFLPGSRTDWHAHPGGQLLHIVAGKGRVQVEGEPLHEVGPGDTVFFGPGEKHWHGASPAHFMVHLAVSLGGAAQWMEPVSEEEYRAGNQ
jgi:quercetin dioxygenase-like cupin family protein